MYWAYAIVVTFLLAMLLMDDNSLVKEVSFTKFEQYVETGGVTKITVYTNTNKAEAIVTDSLGSKIFRAEQFQPGKGIQAKVETDIPSADKIQDQIDLWRQEGVFKGEVNYTKAFCYTHL
ncbi:MAG: ATP-dependent metallopeptidase FtsH/Yme1/Tma family protein, partial [Duncaniella sp.]|nr:ATP-dependent metallopeptidase FtsH/Yme1/Tma family protein [Duncaniella sp.]